MGENERAPSEKELNERAKSGHYPYFVCPFITNIYKQDAKQEKKMAILN